jgi:phosphoribosyl-AMP cyclohydrolase
MAPPNDELSLDFAKRSGLVSAIVQHHQTLEVLMVAWMNREAWDATLSTGKATFWSTSRNELWVKGATSGDTLSVVEVRVDCDQDAVLLRVEPQGQGACHTRTADGFARQSCFYRALSRDKVSLINLNP